MTKRRQCWGILREREHSPRREADDEAILLAVAEALRDRTGVEVEVYEPAAVPACSLEVPQLVFSMCEGEAALDVVEAVRRRGARTVNEPRSVHNTLRGETRRRLGARPFFPASWLVSTGGRIPELPESVWVKRGDYHATTAEDVQRVEGPDALEGVLASFRRRKVETALVQRHVDGDLIKFYGVADRDDGSRLWFQWFYHRDQDLRGHAFDPERLTEVCETAARLLGLEVYGGDAIVTRRGAVYVVDVNAWPSFALYRAEAADHIADLLVRKLGRASRAPETGNWDETPEDAHLGACGR